MKHVSQLDGVRGVAILLVLVYHYVPCQLTPLHGSPLYYGCRALSLTWCGVDLFFVLSGFLIAGILLDNRDTSNYFRVFYFRRACRILPLYFLLLGSFLWASASSLATSPSFRWLFQDPLPIWSYATFTQNLFMGAAGHCGPHWLGITWSLAVEEQFYLVVPLLVFLLPRRVLLGVLIAAVLAAPVLRAVFAGFHTFVNTPWRSDSLLSGAALALLVRWPPFLAAVQRHRRRVLALFGLLLAGAALMTWRPALFGAFNHFWLAGLFAVLVLIAFAGLEPRIVGWLRLPFFVWFGQLSYGIYMFHQAVSGLTHGLLRQSAPQMQKPADLGVTALALGATLLLAWVSYRFFEKPILRIGHRYQYDHPTKSAEGPHTSAPGGNHATPEACAVSEVREAGRG